ncbi:MAG: NAD(P)-binding protein [Bacteriovoracaceae bacterium]|nr:NAD(P)-binding protein [Bacteriovoracaceae bacterium]
MKKFCIIGAGITGVSLANELSDHVILEKSRGIGGRLAARRLTDISINHGTDSFFHPKLRTIISDPHSWIKEIATKTNIRTNWEVKFWRKENSHFEIFDTKNNSLVAQNIILTTPAPQTQILLKQSGLNADFLNDAEYKPEIQFMVLVKTPYDATKLDKFLSLKQRKIHGSEELLFYHLKNEFMGDFINRDKDEIKLYFKDMVDGNVLDCHAHKWRYSEVTKTIPSSSQIIYANQNIYFAGDYFEKTGIPGSLSSVDYLLPLLTRT